MNVHRQKNAQRQKGSGASIVTRARENSGASIVPRAREKRPPLRERGIPYDQIDVSDIDFFIYLAPKPEEIELSSHLNRLSWSKGSDREAALASLIKRLIKKDFMDDYDYLEGNLITFTFFLQRCFNFQKKDSASLLEKQLSLHTIGLLALIVEGEDKMSEIYGQLLPLISMSLESGHEPAVKLLQCLAVVSFFGATNSEETETAMQVVWNFISAPESAKELLPEVLVAGIYSWMFLLTSMEGWRLSYNYWNGGISYFCNLLEHADKSVCVAATEALALIFETGSLDKFWRSEEKDPSSIKYSDLQQLLTENVLTKLKSVYPNMRGDVNAAKKVRQIIIYFQNFCCPGASVAVNGIDLKLSSWYQMIQWQFLKGFIADGFELHMKENEKLWRVFNFDPYEVAEVGEELYASTTDKSRTRFFSPKERDPYLLTKEATKKERAWRNSHLDKARTQSMNKQRRLSQELNSWI
ncbi:unnamed protein product [Malus baccata var. baccata]